MSHEFLTALLESLINPALSLRLHAAHAIGGLVYAITQFETCDELRRQLSLASPIATDSSYENRNLVFRPSYALSVLLSRINLPILQYRIMLKRRSGVYLFLCPSPFYSAHQP